MLLTVGATDAFGYLERQDTQSEMELEYFGPFFKSERDPDMYTASLNLQKVNYADDFVSVHSGWTVTRAWGTMESDGVHSKCNAWGIGPTGMIRLRLMGLNFLGYSEGDVAELSIDMSGAVIFWNKDFPTGGDFYDFMWRVGPKLSCLIGENTVLNVGYKWMHVSNGQWEWHDFKTDFQGTKNNPAWNGKGITVTIVTYL
jgi:hypothetical protein